jgi:hypothetical protein
MRFELFTRINKLSRIDIDAPSLEEAKQAIILHHKQMNMSVEFLEVEDATICEPFIDPQLSLL